MTASLWSAYLKNQWLSEGRTISDPINSVTTSEAQSYTLLRAVWENDQKVFKTTWDWTRNNLMQNNGLFAWRWGKNPDGNYGVMTGVGGQNTAADADCDIALSLLMAAAKWKNPAYQTQATAIVKAIWKEEVVKVKNMYYLAADNLEKTAQTPYIVINPSYFSPYSYRVFAKIDPANSWNKLASDCYVELNTILSSDLGSTTSDGLPPDWAIVNRYNGLVSPSPNPDQDTNFGFNAFRTVWRLTLDWQWFHINAAKHTLKRFGFLYSQWQKHHQLFAIYSHNGSAQVDYSSLAMYGGTLGYFALFHPSSARNITLNKIINPLFNPKTNKLKINVDYYDNSWLWFGLRQYDHALPDLARSIK